MLVCHYKCFILITTAGTSGVDESACESKEEACKSDDENEDETDEPSDDVYEEVDMETETETETTDTQTDEDVTVPPQRYYYNLLYQLTIVQRVIIVFLLN